MDQPTGPTASSPATAPDPAGPPPAPPPGPPAAPPGPPAAGSRPSAPGPAAGLAYATVGVRLVAYIIDGIILGVIDGTLGALFGIGFLFSYGFDVFRPGRLFDFALGGGFLAYVLLAAAVSGVYFVYTWTRNGASVGQSLLNLEVRNAADGARLTQDQAIRRWAFLTVPIVSALPGVGGLVFIYQLFLAYTVSTDPAKQGFHDKQVGSVVVRRMA